METSIEKMATLDYYSEIKLKNYIGEPLKKKGPKEKKIFVYCNKLILLWIQIYIIDE